MLEDIKLYKTITVEILEMLNKEEVDAVDDLFNKRQTILDKAGVNKEFKAGLLNEGVLEMDKQIHEILSNKMKNIKNEIKENRLSQKANNSYMNSCIEKLNIFNKKV